MTKQPNPLLRTVRLAYRAARSPWGQDVLAGASLLAFAFASFHFLALACVALHGPMACS